jgi:hypothetical protein
MHYRFVFAAVCTFALLLIWGCPAELTGVLDDDDVSEDDDDDVADDDTVADDDDDDDTVADDDDDTVADDDDDTVADDDDTVASDVDDNTCDEGATATSAIHFMLFDSYAQPIQGATLTFHDLDAETGVVDPAVVHTGTTDAGGVYDATLDCAYGWMAMDVEHPDFITQHVYFRVLIAVYWPLASVATSMSDLIVGWFISDPTEGVLAVYKASTLGSPDFQGADTLSVDGSANLVPAAAANDFGVWMYDNAQTIVTELAGIHFADHDVPSAQAPAYIEYTDATESHTTVVNVPVWSWDSGNTNPDMSVVYVVD